MLTKTAPIHDQQWFTTKISTESASMCFVMAFSQTGSTVFLKMQIINNNNIIFLIEKNCIDFVTVKQE